jgi:hypothetical protein
MIPRQAVLRIARPTDNIQLIAQMYQQGLGFELLGQFEDHQGFDGIIIGHPEHGYHLEFTHHRGTRVGRAPTQDNLMVFYIPNAEEWRQQGEQMEKAGFAKVASPNPYWDQTGSTFEDADGYRVVLARRDWTV